MHSPVVQGPANVRRSAQDLTQDLAGSENLDSIRAALAQADVIRIDMRMPVQDGAAMSEIVEEISRLDGRPRLLVARLSGDSCMSAGAALPADAVGRVEIWIPYHVAASPNAGLQASGLVSFLDQARSRGKGKLRAVFEVTRATADRLPRLIELAVHAGFAEVGFEPLFVVDEREVPESVFFDRERFNAGLDSAIRTAKRQNIFVDAIKFGSQATPKQGSVPGRGLAVISFDDGRSGSDPSFNGDVRASARVGRHRVTVVQPSFFHMDVAASHFGSAAMASDAFRRRTAELNSGDKFLEQHGPLFERYGLDAALYLSVTRRLAVPLPAATTAGDPDAIAALNEAIERKFLESPRSQTRKVTVDLTKPFLGINWGHARQNFLPDQRQFWRTFNQGQLASLYVQVETGCDYTVRTVIHNATPGDSIDFLQLACNGYVPADQAISWEGHNCMHVCTVPAGVVEAAAGRLCLSFAITRKIEHGAPAEVGLRLLTVEPARPSEGTLRGALLRIRSAITLTKSSAPGALERRNGYGDPLPAAEIADFGSYLSRADEAGEVARSDGRVVAGKEQAVAAFSLRIAEKMRDDDVGSAVARILAQVKEIVEKRVDWIKFPPVEHRYSDTEVTYGFFTVLRRILQLVVPAADVLTLFEALAEKNAALRPAWLAIADCHLDAGRPDQAIQAARAATHRDVCCVISQEVLREAYVAKFPESKSDVIDGVPVYDLSDRFCSIPFHRIETAKDGIVWTCCPAWLGAPIGNMHRMEWDAAWNSDQAGLMRESILDGSFRYCNKGVCPAILSNDLPKKSDVRNSYFRHYIDNNIVKIPEGPREISISHDPSCNLACPQCRNDFILADDARNSEFAETIDSFIKPLIEYAQIDHSTILMSGDGEIFISPHYHDVLKLFDPEKHADVAIKLLSNGLVFETGWKKVPNIHKLVSSVTISTDAGSEEVYRVTRGGSWEKLYRNLQYISSLRKRGEIKLFGIHYAVQTCNYKDMKRMVEIGLELGVDRIAFAILRNSGVYEPADYAARCIFEAGHPDHGEFVRELEDPIFRLPLVDLGQFAGFLRAGA